MFSRGSLIKCNGMDRTVNDETSLSVHAPSGSASVSPFSGPHLTLSLADAASSAPLAIEDGVLESVEEQLKTLSNSLFSACAKGDAPAVSAAIVEMTQNYGGAFAVDLPSDGGRCPVEVAILGAHCDVIDVLVNAKASLVLQDGRSVLDIAIEADRPGVLAHLLQMHCEASRTRTTSDTQWLVEDLEVSSKTRGMQPNEVVDDPTMRPDAGQVEHGAASASNNALRRSPGAALGSRTSKIAELKGTKSMHAHLCDVFSFVSPVFVLSSNTVESTGNTMSFSRQAHVWRERSKSNSFSTNSLSLRLHEGKLQRSR